MLATRGWQSAGGGAARLLLRHGGLGWPGSCLRALPLLPSAPVRTLADNAGRHITPLEGVTVVALEQAVVRPCPAWPELVRVCGAP